ncbi:MAG: flagellar export protein FliJ [Bdellovibrionaceae bacterium]|nr:flagellar export protein FliJ [Bdellovibrionales bacterium]MCB9086470.1 flagellar export protein FliJ [Pseudobdellovibrionaceae bacterium]
MSYKFPFETLLKHRKRIEEAAQRDYFQAKLAVDESLDKINGMYKSLDQTRTEIQQLQKGGNQAIASINQREEYINGLRVRIEQERQVARQLMMVAEEKLHILMEAAKEHKSLDKLKEKRSQEHRQAKKKKEIKEVDEMVTMRHKRGSVA